MTRIGDRAGLVLSPNEIWLLLHALSSADLPRIGWDGDPVDTWVIGELKAKLQRSLNPDKIAADERRPAIALDSQMGRDLANAGIRPLVVDNAFDLGSMFEACALRGWGVELSLPRGAVPETPAMATIRVKTRGEDSSDDEDEQTYVGLEQPAVALARALIGALVALNVTESTDIPAEEPSRANIPLRTVGRIGDEEYEEFGIYATGIQRGRKQGVIAKMSSEGWELIRDEGTKPGDRLVFRRPLKNGG